MTSKIEARGRRPTSAGTGAAGSLCGVVLCVWGGVAAAQNEGQLTNLVFEPVPLAAAAAADGAVEVVDTDALLASAEEHLAAADSLRAESRPSRSERAQLAEELALLAVVWQGLGRHEAALAVLDEAIEIVRDLHGRNAPEQIPLHEQRIPSYLALADIKGVDDAEELVYELKERTYDPGGRQMFYATINLADWYTAAYYRENYGAGNRALRRQMGVIQRVQRCIAMPGRVNDDGSRACDENPIFSGQIKDVSNQDITDIRLRKVDRLYKSFQEDLIDSGSVQLDILIDLSKRVARLAFSTKQEMDFERDNYVFDPLYEGSREQTLRNSPARLNESYISGERALQQAIEFPTSAAAGLRPEALAALYLDLGDWYLAFGKAAGAEEAYGMAYQVLLDAGFAAPNIDRAVASELPMQIPVFAVHLYSRRSTGFREDAVLERRGYLDVGYSIDSLGNASGIRLLDSSGEDSAEVWRLLDIQLQSMKFRPVLRGGELVDRGPVEVRYHYSY